MDPEDDHKVVEDDRTVFRLHGTDDRREKVKADMVIDAILQGCDIDVRHADIEGGLDIRMTAIVPERTKDGRLVTIKGNIGMFECNISGCTYFGYTQFSGEVDFMCTQFSGDADFLCAHFSGNANFRYAHFSGRANFNSAQFSEYAYFGHGEFGGEANFNSVHFQRDAEFAKLVMAKPADFADVTFRENHVLRGPWNATLGRMKRLHWQVTDFPGFNTEMVMDGPSNPWLKRYIDDEQWIKAWKQRGWLRKFLFVIWELTSHCGRSVGLWTFWMAVILTVFAFIYQSQGIDIKDIKDPRFWNYLHYSSAIFTKFGLGDIIGLKDIWKILSVGIEMVLGYVMLGGLISIFANKFARRS